MKKQREIQIINPTENDINSAISNLPPPPETIMHGVADSVREVIERIPPPPPPPVPEEDKIQIFFMDSDKPVVIPRVWTEQCPYLLNKPIMRERHKFLMFIMPILDGSILQSKHIDEQIELSMMINEINFYQVKLTDRQVIELHQSCGFISIYNQMKRQMQEKNSKCFTRAFKKRLMRFKSLWDRYIEGLGRLYNKEIYLSAGFDNLVKTIENEAQNAMVILCRMNIECNNNIYEFFHFLKQCVLEEKDELFQRMVDNIESAIPEEGKNIADIMIETVEALSKSTLKKADILTKLKAVKEINMLTLGSQ